MFVVTYGDDHTFIEESFVSQREAKNWVNIVAINADDWEKFQVWKMTPSSKGKKPTSF